MGEGGSFTGINLDASYNPRLQPSSILAYSTGSAELNLTYCYYPLSGGACPSSPHTGNNGNITHIANGVTSSRSETFAYDPLNRIASAASGAWGESYQIDPWGNLTQFQSYESLPFEESSASMAATAQNQISGYCYDAAGNLLAETSSPCPPTSPTYTYNAENELTSTAGVNYFYDGDGKRVEKYMATDPPFYELYWYGTGTDALEETDGTGSTTDSAFHEYVFLNGSRIARRDASSSGDVEYYFADDLDSTRILTDSSGNTLEDIDYCPYGNECYVATETSTNNYKFTHKEFDTESNLYNFDARFYTFSGARFMSPDPSGISQADPTDPQQLNLYTYVRNNPVTLTDPSGLSPDGCLYTIGRDRQASPADSITDDEEPSDCSSDGGQVLTGGDPQWAAQRRAPHGCGDTPCPPPPPLFDTFVCDMSSFLCQEIYRNFQSPQSPGFFRQVAAKVCSALPQGRATSLTVNFPGGLGLTGSVSTVVNYNNGNVTLSWTGGGQGGGEGASVSSGFIYGDLGSDNSGYSGPFATASASAEGVGGFASFGKTARVYGASLAGNPGAAIAGTKTAKQHSMGRAGALALAPFDPVLYYARQAACP